MRYPAAYLCVALVMTLGACSGGSGSSSAPRAAVTPGGAGIAAVFNQKVTFVITVPASSAASSSVRRARAIHPSAASPAAAATPSPTTPYISPLTGSVQLTLAEIDGVSPQQAPPVIAPINVPAGCQGSTAGCTIPVDNVPAALGTDRYFVQTYSAANATGTLISAGFVDVNVPAKGKTGIGGSAALSIGGFVAAITLSPASLSFVQGISSNGNILVQGLDGAGATIVGAAQFATPITVSVTDTQNFTIGGSTSFTVNGPLAQPLALHYGGGVSATGGTLVQATSENSSGATVSATPVVASIVAPGSAPTATPPALGGSQPTAVPTAIVTAIPTSLPTARPTPKPSPTQKPTQALSLYVADGVSDTVSEYRIVSQIAAGNIPNPAATPSRVIKFDPTNVKSGSVGSAGLSCSTANGSTSGLGNGTAGVAVDPTAGTIFTLPNCTDGNNGYVFGFPASSTGATTPTIYDPFAGGGFGYVGGLALANSQLYAAYNVTGASLGVFGFPLTSNGRQPALSIGAQCYTEFGVPSPGCFATLNSGIAIDRSGFLYVPGYWNDTATGDAAAFDQPAAILTVQATSNSATVAPYSAIAGLLSTVGGSSNPPLAAAVDGSVLYALTGSPSELSPNASSNEQTTYFPGLSACPPPSASAPINAVDPGTDVTQCADGLQHIYLVAYSLTTQLLGIGAFGTDVDLVPDFLVGGDVVGGFGCANLPGLPGGQFLAANAGYVYVINLTSSTCTQAGNISPEIDVYNLNRVNGISGAHTDIAPIFVLPLRNGFPQAITIAPSGTVTGGQAWLRKPPSRTYRPNFFGRRRALVRPLHAKAGISNP